MVDVAHPLHRECRAGRAPLLLEDRVGPRQHDLICQPLADHDGHVGGQGWRRLLVDDGLPCRRVQRIDLEERLPELVAGQALERGKVDALVGEALVVVDARLRHDALELKLRIAVLPGDECLRSDDPADDPVPLRLDDRGQFGGRCRRRHADELEVRRLLGCEVAGPQGAVAALRVTEDGVARTRLRFGHCTDGADRVDDVVHLGFRDQIELGAGRTEADVVRRDDDPAE